MGILRRRRIWLLEICCAAVWRIDECFCQMLVSRDVHKSRTKLPVSLFNRFYCSGKWASAVVKGTLCWSEKQGRTYLCWARLTTYTNCYNLLTSLGWQEHCVSCFGTRTRASLTILLGCKLIFMTNSQVKILRINHFRLHRSGAGTAELALDRRLSFSTFARYECKQPGSGQFKMPNLASKQEECRTPTLIH